PSLVLSCEPPLTSVHETGFSLDYSSHLSWRADGTPAQTSASPSHAFDSLFAQRRQSHAFSVLDRVKAPAAVLTRRVSSLDRTLLDQYFTDVRDVEKRIAILPGAHGAADGSADDPRERMRLMCDIIALAFQTDNTRIASLILARDLSSLRYPFL